MVRQIRVRTLAVLLSLGLAVASTPLAAGDAEILARLSEPGTVLLLRHVLAPGTGDPPGFVLGDCSTQRNLSDVGREQGRALGERLRQAGIVQARIYSSRWCRCLETAELLDLGPVQPLPALDSFFQDRSQYTHNNVANSPIHWGIRVSRRCLTHGFEGVCLAEWILVIRPRPRARVGVKS
jgi:hypothetical protein